MTISTQLKTKMAGLEFKRLELADSAVVDDMATRFPRRISGFTFAALYCWAGVYDYAWVKPSADLMLVSCRFPGEELRHYLQPLGLFDVACQRAFLERIGAADHPVKIFGVEDAFLRDYPEFCARFTIENDPGLANYVYRADDLAQLTGKFYSKKRNLIAQGSAQYEWKAYPLTASHIPDCRDILSRADVTHDGEDRWRQEGEAVQSALLNFAQLGQKGVFIVADGVPAAFSIYEPQTPEMAVVHFEKADRHYKGLYQIINQETAKAIASAGYSLINREEDLGIEGLRQAKHSYGPVEVVASYTLTSA